MITAHIQTNDFTGYGSIPPADSITAEDSDDESDDGDSYSVDDSTNIAERLEILFKFSYPVILAFLLSVSGNCIILYFAGYISRSQGETVTFGGISLATTFTNVTLTSIVDGLTTAVETLSSQYNGAKNYRMVGLVLNRSIIVMFLIATPLLLTWVYVDEIFVFIGVDDGMRAVVGRFLAVRVLSVPVEIVCLCYEKFLMSMGIMQPSLKASFFFNAAMALLCYIFVCVLGWSVEGIAMAFALSMAVELLALVAFSYNRPAVKRTVIMPAADSFLNLGNFLVFGLSGCVMLCAEWWAYEILIVFAGIISEAAVAAQSVLLQLLVISFMFPLGIGIAASTLVGNALGAGKVAVAKELAHLSLGAMLGVSAVICPSLILTGKMFMRLFTTDDEVLAICHSTLKYLVVSALVDGMQGVSSGILRGAGKQHIGAITNMIAFYILGLPCAWWLCFRMNYGVHGLMIGILLGSTTQSMVLLYFVLFQESYVFRKLEHDTSITIGPCHRANDASHASSYRDDHSTAPFTISSSVGALAPNHMLIRGV